MGLEENNNILVMQHGSSVPLRQFCNGFDRAELIQCFLGTVHQREISQ